MHDIRPWLPEPFILPGTLLYIGYRRDACSWLQELYDAGNEISILEIHPPNVTNALGKDDRVARFWCGDVRQVDQIPEKWDYVWYWHGPEHIEKDEFPGVLERIKGKARKLVAVAAPWGVYEQFPWEGNVHETHLWSVYQEDLEAVGMEWVTDGEMDQPGSEIVGWLRA